MKKGNNKHEEELNNFIIELRTEGYKVINLENKSPDAIAVKDDKIIAVEVLGKTYRKKYNDYHASWTVKQKKDIYSMFDDVFIKVFKYGK